MSVDASMTPGPHADAQLGLFDVAEESPRGTRPAKIHVDTTRVRYIGSKARIVDLILETVGPPGSGDGFFVDAFAGTGVVGARAGDLGWPVRLNDHLLSSVITSAARLLGSDVVSFSRFGGYENAAAELNNVRPRPGFLWREYSPASLDAIGIERRYFTEDNAAKLDAMRATIEAWAVAGRLTKDERILLIADLLSAANAVANIAGTYGCFMRKWLESALRPVVVEPRCLRPKSGSVEIYNVDVDAVPIAYNDVAYFDPPYTKRQYAAYYHILETIAHGDEPEVGGITGLRPWHEKASAFCYKTRALDAISSLLEKAASRRIYLSYSSEGHVSRMALERTLASLGRVTFHDLGDIGRYRPNQVATENASYVSEFLIELEKPAIAEAVAA
jgi:adenine-specific DNA-methyltransferase